MRGILSGILGSLAAVLIRQYRRLSLELLKIHAAMWYLQGVSAARKVFLGALALALCLVVAGGGFILFHIGLFALLPGPWNGIVLMALGALYVVAVLLVLRWLCSEKTWLKYSKAGEYAASAASRQRR